MRGLYIIVVAFLVLTVGYLIWQTVTGSNNTTSPAVTRQLTLTDLPVTYCPKQVRVVTRIDNNPESTGKVLAVTNCRSIDFSGFTSAVNDQILYVKLPQALSFALFPADFKVGFQYAPELGDTNNDGSIDEKDEQAVTSKLFSKVTNDPIDVDADGSVTVTDLSLVRLHRGVAATAGASSDLINWNQIK